MKVLVIGGGVGGLSVAHGLQRDGADVTVREQGPAERPQGSGLSLFRNGFAALDALGLGDAVRDLAGPRVVLAGGQRNPAGRWLVRVEAGPLDELRVVHRAELHRLLVDALAPGTCRFASPASLADGRDFDLVIGADGLRSATRTALGLDPGVRFAGYGAWRGVTAGPVEGVVPSETWGRGLRFGLVPLTDGRIYWFAVRDGDPAEPSAADPRDRVLTLFGGWHDPIRRVVEATDPTVVSWLPIVALAGLPSTFVRGDVVLLGDAAHAMTPNLGQGANQSFEDAATLVALLRGVAGARHPDRASVTQSLARYDQLRRPRARAIARASLAVGMIAQTRNPLLAGLRDVGVRLTPAPVLLRQLRRFTCWEPPA